MRKNKEKPSILTGEVQVEGAPVEFGKNYRDRITGFLGTCTGMVRYISGCDQVLLQPTLNEGQEYKGGTWFDDERLIDVESERLVQVTSGRGSDTPAPAK